MRPPSISSEEFETVNFEEPPVQANPPPSSVGPSSSISTCLSVDDLSIRPDAPAVNGNGSEPPLEAIDSFLPILKFLSGLTLIDGTYHYRGPVSPAEIEKMCAYIGRIGEFTVTDNIDGEQYRVHPGTLLRAVQLISRVAPGPLFPSLNRLRIVDVQSPFDHLNLFLTPTLRSLEVINIPEAENMVLSIFLDAISEEAPDLTQIRLGPGRVPGHLLGTFSMFNQLSQLELIELVPSVDFAFLESIGNMPSLEGFVLHAKDSSYARPKLPELAPNDIQDEPRLGASFTETACCSLSAPHLFCAIDWRSDHMNISTTAPIQTQAPVADQLPEIPDSLVDGPMQSTTSPSTAAGPPGGSVNRCFSVLKKLHAIGSLALIEDLFGLVASKEIMDLALTLVWSPSPPVPAIVHKPLKKKKGVTAPVVKSFATVFKLAHQKWFKTLTRICIGRKEAVNTASSVLAPVFPAATFGALLLHHTLKSLEVIGWTLDSSTSNTFQLLAAKAPFKLESLRLPIDSTSPGFSLTGLRTIAETCPQLVYLRCNIEHLDAPEYPSRMPATNVLAHGLEVLSVGNSSFYSDPQHPLRVARHLNVLFPNLKKIETHERHNDEQWKYIGNLVELCQNAHLDATEREKVAYAK